MLGLAAGFAIDYTFSLSVMWLFPDVLDAWNENNVGVKSAIVGTSTLVILAATYVSWNRRRSVSYGLLLYLTCSALDHWMTYGRLA